MKFRYRKFLLPQPSPVFGTSFLKPIVPIELSCQGPEKKVRYEALVDSGADFSIVDGLIGDRLGIDVRLGKRGAFVGIQKAKPAEVFMHEILLNIGGWDYKTTIGFSYDISQKGYGILGQKGFFDIFVVKFDLLKEEIELKERTTG